MKVSHQQRKKKVSTRLPSRSLQELPWLPQSCPHRSHPSVRNENTLLRRKVVFDWHLHEDRYSQNPNNPASPMNRDCINGIVNPQRDKQSGK